MADRLSNRSKAIQAKINDLQKEVQKYEAQAKQYLAKSQASKGSSKQMYKQKALMALQRKKQYMKQIQGYMNQQMTLDKASFATQSMKNHQQMMGAMQQALTEQKKQLAKIDIDKMQDIQDEMLDMKFESDYMNHMMNQNYDLDVDQDELDDQLMEFEREIAKQKKQNQQMGQQQKQPNYNQAKKDINSFMK